jgi:hypothetical protein
VQLLSGLGVVDCEDHFESERCLLAAKSVELLAEMN